MILRDMTVSGRLPSLRNELYYGGPVTRWAGDPSLSRAALVEWQRGRVLQRDVEVHEVEDACAGVYGKTLEQISEEWQMDAPFSYIRWWATAKRLRHGAPRRQAGQ